MGSNEKVKGKRKRVKMPASEIEASEMDVEGNGDKQEHIDYVQSIEYSQRDTFTLKYEVNDKGIGQLLLPPSLSLLLQSDRVSISPSAGGLFIRSI